MAKTVPESETHLRDVMSNMANKKRKTMRPGSNEFLKPLISNSLDTRKYSMQPQKKASKEKLQINISKLKTSTHTNQKGRGSKRKEEIKMNFERKGNIINNLGSANFSPDNSSSGDSFSSTEEMEGNFDTEMNMQILQAKEPNIVRSISSINNTSSNITSQQYSCDQSVNTISVGNNSFEISLEEIDEEMLESVAIPSTSKRTLNNVQASNPPTGRNIEEFMTEEELCKIFSRKEEDYNTYSEDKNYIGELEVSKDKQLVFGNNIQNLGLDQMENNSPQIIEENIHSSLHEYSISALAPDKLKEGKMNVSNSEPEEELRSKEENKTPKDLLLIENKSRATTITPNQERDILSQLRIIARGAYNLANSDVKGTYLYIYIYIYIALEPFLNNIEQLIQDFPMKLLNNYSMNVKQLLVEKHRAQGNIKLLDSQMGKVGHKSIIPETPSLVSEFSSASPPSNMGAVNMLQRMRTTFGNNLDIHKFNIQSTSSRQNNTRNTVKPPKYPPKGSVPSSSNRLSIPTLSGEDKNRVQKNNKSQMSTQKVSVKGSPKNKIKASNRKFALPPKIQIRPTTKCQTPKFAKKSKANVAREPKMISPITNRKQNRNKTPPQIKSKEITQGSSKRTIPKNAMKTNKSEVGKDNILCPKYMEEVIEEFSDSSQGFSVENGQYKEKKVKVIHLVSPPSMQDQNRKEESAISPTIQDIFRSYFLESYSNIKDGGEAPNFNNFNPAARRSYNPNEKYPEGKDTWADNFKKGRFEQTYKKVIEFKTPPQNKQIMNVPEEEYNSKFAPTWGMIRQISILPNLAPAMLKQLTGRFDAFQKSFEISNPKPLNSNKQIEQVSSHKFSKLREIEGQVNTELTENTKRKKVGLKKDKLPGILSEEGPSTYIIV